MLVGIGLTRRFGEVVALDHADVRIRPGQITILVGPSGSGKTTLIRCLAMIDTPNEGKVSVDGMDYVFPETRGQERPRPWPQVTVVFQQLFLWPHLTLRQNILLPLLRMNHPTDPIQDLTELFGMSKFLDRYPNEVSVGQRQRAALARALAVNPQYLLLDEITSALDVEQASIVMRQLIALRDRGIGILLVTHLLGYARRILERHEGDRICFMDGGHLLAEGDLDLLDNPKEGRLRQFLLAGESPI